MIMASTNNNSSGARQPTTTNKHGGHREGAGRPKGAPKKYITIRLGMKAIERLEKAPNKSLFIEALILSQC